MSEVWTSWFDEASRALLAGDGATTASLFAPDGHWRDMVAMTWNIATFQGRADIAAMVGAQAPAVGPVTLTPAGAPTVADDLIEGWARITTRHGRGRAHVRLRRGDQGWQCWTLLTTLTDLAGHPWAEGHHRVRGPVQHAVPHRRSMAEEAAGRRADLIQNANPEVLIIGGGQAGMGLGARLDALGVSNVILERQGRAGDSWRSRYESLALHDPVWYDHMPYLPFPEGWPVFTPKDMMADWLEMFERVMGLTYLTNATAERARRVGDHWEVAVDHGGKQRAFRPRHLVFATGMSGYPRIPAFKGADSFLGDVLHSSAYRTGRDHAGSRAVIIGANTSAHDIALDLWEHGSDVTMVQRSSTLIARSATVVETLLGPLYSEEAIARGIGHEEADFLATTWPWALAGERAKPLAARMAARDRDLHERLEARGFLLDIGEDGAGIPMKSARRGGGFYIDVGASELIADGTIGLAAGKGIDRIEPDAVVLQDGTRLPCDLIVHCTGFRSMNSFVADICGQATADAVGRVWGIGSGLDGDPGPWEGELRNMWKPTAVDGLWFTGGNLAQSRHFSRFLALQLKARLAGAGTPVYGRPEVHHLE